MQAYLGIKIRCLLFILSFLSLNYANAKDITIIANAPDTVVKGEQFKLTYILENGEAYENVKLPSFIKGFDIHYGPSVSSTYTETIINGKPNHSYSQSYTYVLTAQSEGDFTLPATSIKINGRTYTSNSVRVKVIANNKTKNKTKKQLHPYTSLGLIRNKQLDIERHRARQNRKVEKTGANERNRFGVVKQDNRRQNKD